MSFLSRRSPLLLTLLVGALLQAGCSSLLDDTVLGRFAPYRMEVVQGNVVTREMADQLRPGLTREQVRGLLGSPLLADIFHADRWDYVFTIRRQGAAPQQRRVTVYFANDRVARHEGSNLPSELEFVSAIDVAKPEPRKAPLELNESQLRALPLPQARSTALAVPAPADAASVPRRVYPPLEPGITP